MLKKFKLHKIIFHFPLKINAEPQNASSLQKYLCFTTKSCNLSTDKCISIYRWLFLSIAKEVHARQVRSAGTRRKDLDFHAGLDGDGRDLLDHIGPCEKTVHASRTSSIEVISSMFAISDQNFVIIYGRDVHHINAKTTVVSGIDG